MSRCVWRSTAAALTAVSVVTMVVIASDASAQNLEPVHQHAASTRAEGPPVTLASLMRDALEANPELAALRDQIEVARQRPAQERGLMPPMADAQIWQWPVNSVNPADTNMYMFMVGQDLPGRGKRDARAAVVDKDAALASADVTIRARQIVNEIRQAYAALFIARKAAQIHLDSVDVLNQIADVAQSKYAAGRGSQADALKPILEVSKVHNDVIVHDEEAALAAARLNVLLNRAPDTPIGPLDGPSERWTLPSPADLQGMALANQPELQRARIEIDKADASLASARLERKPDFNIQGGYQVMPNQTDGWLAKVGVTWPNAPWSRGRIDAKIAEESAAASAARSRLRAMENMLRLSVQDAYIRASAARDRAALVKTTILPQTQQAFDASLAAYQADRGDFQSILDTERMRLDAELEYYRTVVQFTQAVADLERAIGADLEGR